VKDTGIGIPPEDIPHLFERFHRGRNASRYMGNGLGLAIVKALVEAQGGCVRAESEERVGTTIIVMLPLRS
jgi:signal transduction histidine kinase